MQQRLGNQGAQAFATQVVARACAPGGPLVGGASAGQFSISPPDDAHAREAERVADADVKIHPIRHRMRQASASV